MIMILRKNVRTRPVSHLTYSHSVAYSVGWQRKSPSEVTPTHLAIFCRSWNHSGKTTAYLTEHPRGHRGKQTGERIPHNSDLISGGIDFAVTFNQAFRVTSNFLFSVLCFRARHIIQFVGHSHLLGILYRPVFAGIADLYITVCFVRVSMSLCAGSFWNVMNRELPSTRHIH